MWERSSWVLAFACCAALVALSVLFVDKKFALQMHTSFHDTPVYRTALGSFLLFEIGGMALLVAALAILALRAKRLTRWMLQLVAGAATGAGALIVAESLKASLGRTPVYPTFLVDGVSAFHPLHRGSFPSATTACVTAVMTVASASWPWGRLAWGIIALLAPLMILITNSHWLSDVIAGAFLGWGLGVATAGIILRRFPGFQDSHGGRR